MTTTRELLAIRAESFYEELGGDLCRCQNVDEPYWCEKCQQRIAYILTMFTTLRREGAAEAERERAEVIRYLRDALAAARDALVSFQQEAGYLRDQNAYATTLTERERQLARAVTALDNILRETASPQAADAVGQRSE
jgi:hypothetical protein